MPLPNEERTPPETKIYLRCLEGLFCGIGDYTFWNKRLTRGRFMRAE